MHVLHISGFERSERPAQAIAYAQFISFCVEGRAAVEVVQERKVEMEIVHQLQTEGRLGSRADAGSVG